MSDQVLRFCCEIDLPRLRFQVRHFSMAKTDHSIDSHTELAYNDVAPLGALELNKTTVFLCGSCVDNLMPTSPKLSKPAIIQYVLSFYNTMAWQTHVNYIRGYVCLLMSHIHRTKILWFTPCLSCYPQLSPPVAPSDLIQPPETALLSPWTIPKIPAMMLPWDRPCWRCWSECEGKLGNHPFWGCQLLQKLQHFPIDRWKWMEMLRIPIIPYILSTDREPHQFQKWNSATPVVSRLLKYFGLPQEALLRGYLPRPRHVQQHLWLGGQGVHQRSDPALKLEMAEAIGCCRQFLLEKHWFDVVPPHSKQQFSESFRIILYMWIVLVNASRHFAKSSELIRAKVSLIFSWSRHQMMQPDLFRTKGGMIETLVQICLEWMAHKEF